MSVFSLRLVGERGGQIRFIRAMEKGLPCWFYLKLDPSRFTDYERRVEQGGMDISEFGTILESGWGVYPPADVVSYMRDTYDFITPEDTDEE